MREHSNSCTKRPLKDNNMTLIYAVYHGHHPNWASAFADARFGHQQTCQQTTTFFFLNHHHHHNPQCPPIVTTSPSLPTTNNHLDMPLHHPNNTETPRQQLAGQWEAMMMTWHVNRHLMVTALSTHSPSPQSPSWPWNRCHIIYMATRQWTMMLFVVVFSGNKWLTTMMTDHNHNHNRQQPCHNNGRTTPCDETMTWHQDVTMMQPWQHTTHERHQWRWVPNTTPLPSTLRAQHHCLPTAMSAQHHTPPMVMSAHHPPMTRPTMMTTWQHDNDNAMQQWHYVVYFSYL